MFNTTDLIKTALFPFTRMVPQDEGARSMFWKGGAALFAVGLIGQQYSAQKIPAPPNHDFRPVHVKRSLIGTAIGAVIMMLPNINRITGLALTRMGLLPAAPWVDIACAVAGLAVVAIGRLLDCNATRQRLHREADGLGSRRDAELVRWRADHLGQSDWAELFGRAHKYGTSLLIAFGANYLYHRL